MPGAALTLPMEATWKLLGASPDMMDVQFCNKRFPFRWRSSLAVWASEPDPATLPGVLCEGRITLLKITATITGYQPSREETEEGYASFPNVPTEELSRIIDQYFACYGALLNVAVFPNPNRKVVEKRTVISFAGEAPNTSLPNPFLSGGATFTGTGQSANQVVDTFPPGGDSVGELDLFQEMVVTCPPALRVEAKVVHRSVAGVTMDAFSGTTAEGSQTAPTQQDQIHTLVIAGSAIDRVVFTAPQGGAVLLEFAYVTTEARPFNLLEYPHVIDAEPKTRELIQAASEVGEILTSSKSNVKTNKALTHTDSTETGYKLGATGGVKDKFNVSGEITHKNTETEQENWSVATDASRERSEKQGSTTQISQLYNLLTSYHLGTNRAQFLMLARPHVLQPSDHRTFVDGLRQIEGVQEVVLIVARPPEMAGLYIEAFLETGHFPEGLTAETPPEVYDESAEEFTVTAFADNGWFSGDTTTIKAAYDVGSGWVVDIRPERGPDPGHPGMQEVANNSNSQANSSLEDYNYRRIADATVEVTGKISGQSLQRDKARFNRTYRVFTRSVQPKPNSAGPKVPIENLLITSRGLCVGLRSGDPCPVPDAPILHPGPGDHPDPGDIFGTIVDERPIRLRGAVLTRSATAETRTPATKELLRQIHHAMTVSGRLPQRRPFGEAPGFLGSDYFKNQIKKFLPREQLERPLADISGVPGQVLDSFGRAGTVADVLDLDLARLAERTGMSMVDAAKARRFLLGEKERPSTK